MIENLSIYKNKKILLTGHTGFKGSWLAIWLNELGSKTIGYSLKEYDNTYVFDNSGIKERIIDVRGDITDIKKLKETVNKYKPEIIFHLAAQPLVRRSYDEPLLTFKTNIMGTINVLECINQFDFVKSAIIITTDKCYKNKESIEGYAEDDELGGDEPYSASKACAEIIVESYHKSFFKNKSKLVSTVRAGNVLGGGDFGKDRIMPDVVKHLKSNKNIKIRNPNALRPWQHVIEPLYGYLLLGKRLLEGRPEFVGCWNFGPNKSSIVPVKKVVELTIEHWGEGQWVYVNKEYEKKPETKFLILNIEKAKKILRWHPKWNINTTIEKTVEWYKNKNNKEIYDLCKKQIKEYGEFK
jgi:CDP-glucose 4,6-dehydratase